MRYLGCAYYPEYWGRERFEEDARLMSEAGINIARIGEFAWCRMEPEEGRYTFDWLHECVATLARHGVQSLLCTPTAAPPAWLTRKYPDVLLVRADGRRASHGSRRHYCSTSPAYREHSARIAAKLAAEFGGYDSVVGWQIDNELGPESGWCHCEGCQKRFQDWLRDRYGTIETLNQRWRTGFWSMDYSDWSEVRLGADAQGLYSSRNLDSKRFWSEMMIEYGLAQAEVLRQGDPGAIVTTNGMGPIFQPIDYYKLFGALDVACDDLYFDIGTMDTNVLAMNTFRGMKPGRRYWITETGSGALDHGRPPAPGQFRAWAWSNIAHGGDAHFVFRWRTCLSGQEQELQGILEHSGHPGHRYRAVSECFREIRALEPALRDLPLPEAPVAIVQDYQVLWGYESSRVEKSVGYLGQICRLHKDLWARNIVADVIPPDRDFSSYRLVILPSLVMVAEDTARRLAEYVAGGGTVLATGQLGLRDFWDNYLPEPGPAHLGPLFGIRVVGGMYLHSFVGPDEGLWWPEARKRDVEIPVTGRLNGLRVSGMAGGWAADAYADGADVLLSFAGDIYSGQPAMTERQTGAGRALYCGVTRLTDNLQAELVEYALHAAGIKRGPATPEWVEVVRRGRLTFVINHSDDETDVLLGHAGRALVGTFEKGVARVQAFDVCVVERTDGNAL